MSKKNNINSKDEFINFFSHFKKAIFTNFKSNIQSDLSKIEDYIDKLSSDDWEHNNTSITFTNIDLGQGAMPNSAYRGTGKVKLKFSGKGRVYEKNEICNPLQNMSMELLIVIERKKDGILKPLTSAWHLDKHSDTQKAGEKNVESNFSHPEYHFHFGGRQLTDDQNISGNILLIGSPRIQYFPMDIILAIDFVIQNFYEKEKRTSLTKNPDYVKAVQNAKQRIWKPYIIAMAKEIGLHSSLNDFQFTDNFPQQTFGH